MNRVAFFIDGFNVFHALDYRAPRSPRDTTKTTVYHKYKWLDYSALAKCFTLPGDRIVDIYYFTAYAEWRTDKVERHKLFTDALVMKGVKIILGNFKKRDKKCPLCKQTYQTHEEKQTDVNISVRLFQSAHNDDFDKAFLITGDSDIIPSVIAVKESFPQKHIGIIVPIGRSADELKKFCDSHMKMKEEHLKRSQFPDKIIIDPVNNKFLERPSTWV